MRNVCSTGIFLPKNNSAHYYVFSCQNLSFERNFFKCDGKVTKI